jgi:uncharacterized protein YbjT (DUF2867 family)
LTNSSILVTGGDGNIGSEVISQLSSKSNNVRIVGGIRSLSKKKNIDNRPDNHDLVEIEYGNPETVKEALKGIDKLFLLTPTDPKMLDFTSNLVNGAKERDVKHIVKLSHIRADPNDEPQINITRLHRQAEKIIEESGIPSTFLHPLISICRTLSTFTLVRTRTQSISLLEMVGLALLTSVISQL